MERSLWYRAWIALVSSALVAALPARAQEPPDPDDELILETVTAEGHGTHVSEAKAQNPTAAVTEIPKRPGEGRTPADQMKEAPGVVIQDLGLNQRATINVRGSNASQVAVELDGISLNPVAGGGVDLSTLPAPLLERLTLVRGSASGLYGSGAMGGALLIETTPLHPGETRLFGSATYGSFNTGSLSLGGAFDLGKENSVLVTLFGDSTRGDYAFSYTQQPQLPNPPMLEGRRENNDGTRFGGLAKVSLRLPARLDLLVEADAGDRGNPGTFQNPNNPAARQNDRRILFGGTLTGDVSGIEARVKAGARLGQLTLSGNPQDEASLYSEIQGKKLLGNHLLVVGARMGYDTLTTPFTPFGVLHSTGDRTYAQAQGALFGSAELNFGPLLLVPLVRLDAVNGAFGVSPRLGASYALPENFALQANLGQAFRVPSLGELHLQTAFFDNNPDLKPEHSRFVDFGLVRNKGFVTGGLTGFFTDYSDLIVYEKAPYLRARPLNIGAATVTGAELELGANLGPWSAKGGYTLAFSTNETDDARLLGKELPYHPRHTAHGQVAGHWEPVFATLDLDYTSMQQTTRANTATTPDALRLDASAGYAIAPRMGLWLSAGVKNLLDQQTQMFLSYPLPGRSFWVNLRFEPPSTPRSSP